MFTDSFFFCKNKKALVFNDNRRNINSKQIVLALLFFHSDLAKFGLSLHQMRDTHYLNENDFKLALYLY